MKSFAAWFKTTYGKLVVLIAILLAASSLGFYFLELKPKGETTLFSAVYWSVVTLTTVGYGDYAPVTIGGRLLGILVMISGIGLVSTLSGNLASLLVDRRVQKRKGLLRVKLSGHVIILGWNSSAARLVATLKDAGVLDHSAVALVNELPAEDREELALKLELGDRLHFVYGNPASKNVLLRAAPESAKLVYILSRSSVDPKEADQQAINTALTLRNMAPKVMTYGEVMLTDNKDNLLRAGVDEIINRGELASHVLGLMGTTPTAWPFFQHLTGLKGHLNLRYRQLNNDEQDITWGELLRKARQRDGALPLALCSAERSLTLQDMLDESSALDQFIMELFSASGQSTQLGHRSTRIQVNPPDDRPVAGFDGILYLRTGGEES